MSRAPIHIPLRGYQSATFLMRLNGDHLLYFATVAAALWAGAFVGALIT